jgi:putative membrane protein
MSLLLGSLLLRPYVFLFLLVFLAAGIRDLGARRTGLFLAWVWLLAFVAEFASTRIGIPFGLYHYTGATRGQELFIADVPFFDSLSFTFLAYASFSLARVVVSSRRALPVAVVAGLVMMLLDVVVDPLAVRGDRWFLGRIFWYPHGGMYFGVPLSNFVGWFLVGATAVGGYVWLAGRAAIGRKPFAGVALYYGVLVFNLVLTAWIQEWALLAAGIAIHLALGLAILGLARSSAGFAGAIRGVAGRSGRKPATTVGRGAEPPSE